MFAIPLIKLAAAKHSRPTNNTNFKTTIKSVYRLSVRIRRRPNDISVTTFSMNIFALLRNITKGEVAAKIQTFRIAILSTVFERLPGNHSGSLLYLTWSLFAASDWLDWDLRVSWLVSVSKLKTPQINLRRLYEIIIQGCDSAYLCCVLFTLSLSLCSIYSVIK